MTAVTPQACPACLESDLELKTTYETHSRRPDGDGFLQVAVSPVLLRNTRLTGSGWCSTAKPWSGASGPYKLV
jgi:hypothetical protein